MSVIGAQGIEKDTVAVLFVDRAEPPVRQRVKLTRHGKLAFIEGTPEGLAEEILAAVSKADLNKRKQTVDGFSIEILWYNPQQKTYEESGAADN